MIFKQFDETDIVAGRTSKVASGFWPGSVTNWSASSLMDNFFDLTQSAATPSPSYGASIYDIRRTMYYVDVFPDSTYHGANDPYLALAYGNFYGLLGSGSFDLDTGSILAHPSKAVYTQYKNLLLGSADVDGQFSFKTGSAGSTVSPDDIFVINFSTYKMKDRVDEGQLEVSFTGSNGIFTFRDDSPFLTQKSSVYNLITGSINDSTTTLPPYPGAGLFYPADGVVVFNATALNTIVGLSNVSTAGAVANYTPNSLTKITVGGINIQTTANHKVFFWSLNSSTKLFKVRKSEYVPARHYFIRVKNRDFNYSNNPTFVWDGTDGIHAAGTIYNEDFVTDPKTYITSVGLYNDNNELVAVAKFSKPAVKSFDNELLIKVRLDF